MVLLGRQPRQDPGVGTVNLSIRRMCGMERAAGFAITPTVKEAAYVEERPEHERHNGPVARDGGDGRGDSAIYVAGQGIRRVLVGIDMGTPELLLAKELGVDAVVAHHPQPAVLTYPQMLWRHADLMIGYGVPEDEARRAAGEIVERFEVRTHAGNYDHAPSAARLLGIPYMNVHNPLDEVGRRRMAEAVEDIGSESTVGDVVDALMGIEEFRAAPTSIEVRMGSASNRSGRVAVIHGAGSNGGYPVATACFRHGIGTVVYIHIDHGELQKLRAEEQGNLVVTGHIASDLVGINPFIEELERRGVEVVRMSGL